jgi:ABC-type glutathione transport system ATPase component
MLEIRNLTVELPDRTRIADGVAFDIGPGEGVGLVGASGCGKTSLARCILGLPPAGSRIVSGSVRFAGTEMLNSSERELNQVRGAALSMVFQEPSAALNPVLRVGAQVAEVIHAHRPWSRGRCLAEASATCRLVRLPEETFHAYPHQLSGGQRQRVLIAQALACRPALVIADEPTSALDSIVQAQILTLFKQLKQQLSLALLFITHNPAILSGLADRILSMHAGAISEQRSPGARRKEPIH